MRTQISPSGPFVGRTTEAEALTALREWVEHMAECDICYFAGSRDPVSHHPIHECKNGRGLGARLFDAGLGCFDWRSAKEELAQHD